MGLELITRGPNSRKCYRWIVRHPSAPILADSINGQPTRPSKPGFVGFVGAPYAKCADIRFALNDPSLVFSRLVKLAARSIQGDLDCSAETTRLMSWSGQKTAAPEWRSVMPAKAGT